MSIMGVSKLLVEMSEREKSESRRPIFTPKKFVNTVWSSLTFWADGSQQDAHEFLQYTMHFINECDLFLRELERKYNIKNIPVTVDRTVQSAPQYNTILCENAKSSTSRFKRASSKQQSTSRQTASSKVNIQQQQQPVTIVNEDSSSSTSSNWSTYSSGAASNSTMTTVSSISSSSSTRLQPLPLPPKMRKSKQPVRSAAAVSAQQAATVPASSPIASDYLRTPTKGGASSSSLDQIIVSSSSSSSLSSSQRSLDHFQQAEIQTNQCPSIKLKRVAESNIYKIVPSTNVKVELDEDLVSRRLRETVRETDSNSKTSIKSTAYSSPSISMSSLMSASANSMSNVAKRMKLETTTSTMKSRVHTSLTDDVIIIDDSSSEDSAFDDDCCCDDEEVKTMEFDDNNSPSESSVDLEERIKSEWERNLNATLNCYVRLERIDVEKVKAGLKRVQTARPGPGRRPGRNLAPKSAAESKRLRSKSKTFPPNQQPSSPAALLTRDMKPAPSIMYLDMDTITTAAMTPSSELSAVASSSCLPTATNNNRSTRSSSTLRSCVSARSLISYDESAPTPTSQPAVKANRSPGDLLRRKSLPNPANTTMSSNNANNYAPNDSANSYPYTCEMDQLFRGALVTVTQCLVCETKRERPETFYDRSIPIDDTIKESVTEELSEEEEEEKRREAAEKCWISKCLVNESYLNDTSKYACDVCACKQEARMHTQYVHMPPVLIFHLLSYGYTSSHDGALNAQKLSNRSRLIDSFEFASDAAASSSKSLSNQEFKPPLNVITRSFIKQHTDNHQFRLFAVVMHSGQTLNSGHYTAFINYKIVSSHRNKSSFFGDLKSPKINQESNIKEEPNDRFENEWLHFDDTKVESMSNPEFHRKIIDSSFNSPYILFYVRTNNNIY